MKYSSVGGRKFILGTACLGTEITLLCIGLISAAIFKEMFLITLGITSGVNVVQKIWGQNKKQERM